jgi:hypothetical protein
MKKILISAFILSTLYCKAGGLDSLKVSMLSRGSETREINLRIRKSNELRTNGALILASGVMFSAISYWLERSRINRNLPDGYNGYSLSKDLALNYGIGALGVGLTLTGGVIIFKNK